MAKINCIPGILLTALLCLYTGAGGTVVGCGLNVTGYGLPVAGYGLNVTGYGLRAVSYRLPVVGYGDYRSILQRIYTAEIGVRELTGKNDGPRVEAYLKAVGLSLGQAYCAAFVCWALAKADLPNPGNGWSPALFPASRLVWQVNNRAKSMPPQTGDVFGIWFPDKKRIAHVGFVDSWTDTWLISVEGNTNEAGSREGDGVYRKRRLTKSIYQVADLVSDPVAKGGSG